MIQKLLPFVLLSIFVARAQDPDPTKAIVTASLRGTVTVAGTGKPMADVEVYANRGSNKEVRAVTDAQGHYELRDLLPGPHRVSANAPDSSGRVGFGPSAVRQVDLQAGQELE